MTALKFKKLNSFDSYLRFSTYQSKIEIDGNSYTFKIDKYKESKYFELVVYGKKGLVWSYNYFHKKTDSQEIAEKIVFSISKGLIFNNDCSYAAFEKFFYNNHKND